MGEGAERFRPEQRTFDLVVVGAGPAMPLATVGAGAIAIQSVHEYLTSNAGVGSGSGLASATTRG
jgi:hypothetical protein